MPLFIFYVSFPTYSISELLIFKRIISVLNLKLLDSLRVRLPYSFPFVPFPISFLGLCKARTCRQGYYISKKSLLAEEESIISCFLNFFN